MRRSLAIATTVGTGLAAAVLIATILNGTRGVGATPPDPSAIDASASPLAVPTPGAESSCEETLTHTTVFDGPEPTLANLSQRSPTVLLGVAKAISVARFTTVDGARPREGATVATSVVRIVSLEGTALREGAARDVTVDVAVLGGTIGCETWVVPSMPSIDVGDEVVVFAEPSPSLEGPDVLRATEVFPVENGVILTPLDGMIPIDDFGERLSSAADS